MPILPTVGNAAAVTKPFANVKGEQFGGGSNYLQLEPGTEMGPFVHVRIDKGVKLTATSDPLDLHIANTPDGAEIRMPASNIFRRNVTEANLGKGDQYHVARLPDTEKKGGLGKGKPMEVWAILVSKRVSGNKALAREDVDEIFAAEAAAKKKKR